MSLGHHVPTLPVNHTRLGFRLCSVSSVSCYYPSIRLRKVVTVSFRTLVIYWVYGRNNTREAVMTRQSTISAADLWARLASRDFVALAPERLSWPRPDRARIVKSGKTLRLPKQTTAAPVRWPEVLAAFVSDKTAAQTFAQDCGLLWEDTEMEIADFDDMRSGMRDFLTASKLGSIGAIDYLAGNHPPIAVNVELQDNGDSVEILLVPRDLLSGMWLIAIRASLHDIKPVRVCALVGCKKPLTGTSRKEFCSTYHRTRAAKRPDLDKRNLRDRLQGIGDVDLETLATVWQEAQRRNQK